MQTAFISGVVLVAGLRSCQRRASTPESGTWHPGVSKSEVQSGAGAQEPDAQIEAAGKGEKVTSETITGDRRQDRDR